MPMRRRRPGASANGPQGLVQWQRANQHHEHGADQRQYPVGPPNGCRITPAVARAAMQDRHIRRHLTVRPSRHSAVHRDDQTDDDPTGMRRRLRHALAPARARLDRVPANCSPSRHVFPSWAWRTAAGATWHDRFRRRATPPSRRSCRSRPTSPATPTSSRHRHGGRAARRAGRPLRCIVALR